MNDCDLQELWDASQKMKQSPETSRTGELIECLIIEHSGTVFSENAYEDFIRRKLMKHRTQLTIRYKGREIILLQSRYAID